MKPLQSRSWLTGAWVAVVVGTVVAACCSIVDWRLNPGGIFHDESGTRWGVVLETAFSWFLPIGLVVFVVAPAMHYLLVSTDSPE